MPGGARRQRGRARRIRATLGADRGVHARVFETTLLSGELVEAVTVPRLSNQAKWGFYKVCRKTGEFANAIGAVLFDPARSVCRAVLGATESRPVVFADARQLFRGDRRRSESFFDQQPAREALAAAGITDDRAADPPRRARRHRAGQRMKAITLTLNGKRLAAAVEPRTHLADFLRETQGLTGTHLGCEHGICGACTLLLDGVPVRSCITYAVACDGAAVTTIEGLDDDEIAKVDKAFSREHALQCGYCTPGVLISARDPGGAV